MLSFVPKLSIMKHVLPLFALFLLLSSCSEVSPEPLELPEQDILFKYEYTNFAWSPQQKGWLLDSAGFILEFENPSTWQEADQNGAITLEQMNSNLFQTTPSNIQLSKESLGELAANIQEAISGALGDLKNNGADMGALTLSAYAFDPQTNIYTEHVVQQEGDLIRENTLRLARQLAEALKNIQKQLEE